MHQVVSRSELEDMNVGLFVPLQWGMKFPSGLRKTFRFLVHCIELPNYELWCFCFGSKYHNLNAQSWPKNHSQKDHFGPHCGREPQRPGRGYMRLGLVRIILGPLSIALNYLITTCGGFVFVLSLKTGMLNLGQNTLFKRTGMGLMRLGTTEARTGLYEAGSRSNCLQCWTKTL